MPGGLRRVRIERVAWGEEESDNKRMFLGGGRRMRIEYVAWWMEESDNRRMLLGRRRRVKIERVLKHIKTKTLF